jgi:hypothetical protein
MSRGLIHRLRYNAWANDLRYSEVKPVGAPEAPFRAFQHVLEAEITWPNRILGPDRPNVPLWGPFQWRSVRSGW